MGHTRHRSLTTMRSYVRRAKLSRENSGRQIGTLGRTTRRTSRSMCAHHAHAVVGTSSSSRRSSDGVSPAHHRTARRQPRELRRDPPRPHTVPTRSTPVAANAQVVHSLVSDASKLPLANNFHRQRHQIQRHFGQIASCPTLPTVGRDFVTLSRKQNTHRPSSATTRGFVPRDFVREAASETLHETGTAGLDVLPRQPRHSPLEIVDAAKRPTRGCSIGWWGRPGRWSIASNFYSC